MLSRRKIIMLIDRRGIYHKDYKWMHWDDIRSIKRKRERGAEEREVFFLIQTAHAYEPYKISISNVDQSEQVIIAAIQRFGSYNIREVFDEF